jgi:hypothetical protein
VPTIAITTDFGIKDGNVGVMKGVIWGICPQAQIADISHTIAPQNILEAGLILARSAPFFPPGTIQLVVVDPGVGTARHPIAARIGSWYFVGPDNGVITMWRDRALKDGLPIDVVVLDQKKYWLPNVSHVFHGRDIFAPVAAHLASGVPFKDFGAPLANLATLPLPQPRRTNDGWEGEIIHIDHFGNAASNIREEHLVGALQDMGGIVVRLRERQVDGVVRTFGERKQGEAIALIGSTGDLIVSIVNGSAEMTLGCRVGDPITVAYTAEARSSIAGAES